MDYQVVVSKVGPLGFHHLEVMYGKSSHPFRYARFQGTVDMKLYARVEATDGSGISLKDPV